MLAASSWNIYPQFMCSRIPECVAALAQLLLDIIGPRGPATFMGVRVTTAGSLPSSLDHLWPSNQAAGIHYNITTLQHYNITTDVFTEDRGHQVN